MKILFADDDTMFLKIASERHHLLQVSCHLLLIALLLSV